MEEKGGMRRMMCERLGEVDSGEGCTRLSTPARREAWLVNR